MIGVSSTWYAMSARLRTSRNSAARSAAVVVLEDAKELLGTVDDRVGLLRLESRAVVDPAPRHGNSEHPCRLGGTDVEGRVADVGSRGGVRSEPFGAEQQRLGVRLVPLGFVTTDNRLEEMAERDVGEGELDGRAALRGNHAEPPALLVQPHEHVFHAGAGLELVVQRLVVRAIDVDEPLDLEGRAIVAEDYVEVRPENAEGLQALLDAGRLEAGPSYVLPDEILVGGESLVRNLLLGRRVCRRFGVEPSGAGYLPDSFGHPAQLPQILAGFGVRTFLFSRGMGDEIDDVGVVFRWRAGSAE